MNTKTLDNANAAEAQANDPGIKIVGNGDAWKLLGKASSFAQGWMKSTKAMEIETIGCLVQVTTQQQNPDGSWSVAEAVTFVPGVYVAEDRHFPGGRILLPYETFTR